ncbi:MAG: hypothetical protein EBT50_08670 [Verrucomicrobia bacterium]|nr:hypothetical protein [Verrucomicrobiota bacterium]
MNPCVQEITGDQGFISLEIEDPVGRPALRGFCDSVGARWVIRSGHDNLCAKLPGSLGNAWVVGCDQHLIDFLALDGSFPYPLDQGLACDQRNGFAREAGGAVAGRNHSPVFGQKGSGLGGLGLFFGWDVEIQKEG